MLNRTCNTEQLRLEPSFTSTSPATRTPLCRIAKNKRELILDLYAVTEAYRNRSSVHKQYEEVALRHLFFSTRFLCSTMVTHPTDRYPIARWGVQTICHPTIITISFATRHRLVEPMLNKTSGPRWLTRRLYHR